MNISLKPEQVQFIQAKMQSGKYETREQVISEALKLLDQRDRHYEKWLEETREKVAVGIDQADRGQLTDGKVVMARLREKIRKASESQV